MIHYLPEQEGILLEVKARKVAQGDVYQCLIGNFFKHFEGFSEHGIFHGIIVWQENNSLKIKVKNGLLIIEWE